MAPGDILSVCLRPSDGLPRRGEDIPSRTEAQVRFALLRLGLYLLSSPRISAPGPSR